MNNAKALAEALKTHLPEEQYQEFVPLGRGPIIDNLIEKAVTAYVLYGNNSLNTKEVILQIFKDGYISDKAQVKSMRMSSPDLILSDADITTSRACVADFVKYYLRPVYSEPGEE